MVTLSSADRALLESPLPPLRRAALPDGGEIEYRCAGQGGPTIILLHGIGSNAGGFRAQFAGLANRFRVFAWNAPGYGASTPLAGPEPAVEDYASQLHRWVQTLGSSPVHVLGCSWGTLIANAYAAGYPGAVRSVVLAAPTRGYGTLEPAEKSRRIAARLAPEARTLAPAVRAAQFLGPAPDALVIKRFGQLSEAVRVDGLAQATRMLFATDGIALAGTSAAPTLILAGSHDQVAPAAEHAWALRAAMPQAESAMLEGCGHILKLEAPSRFNQQVIDFVHKHL